MSQKLPWSLPQKVCSISTGDLWNNIFMEYIAPSSQWYNVQSFCDIYVLLYRLKIAPPKNYFPDPNIPMLWQF